MRITLDSAVLVRANPKSSGPARALLIELLARGHQLILSASILEELERVLQYPRLAKRHGLTFTEIVQFVRDLATVAEIAEVAMEITTPIRDQDDVHILQTAISGGAHCICTLDDHFKDPAVLEFCSAHGITVLTDLELLRIIRNAEAVPASIH